MIQETSPCVAVRDDHTTFDVKMQEELFYSSKADLRFWGGGGRGNQNMEAPVTKTNLDYGNFVVLIFFNN
jgi:hypothetical protein